jgi:hypothetical protein
MNECNAAKQNVMRQLQSLSSPLLVIAGFAVVAGAAPRQEKISVSVSRARVAHGERVELKPLASLESQTNA